MSDSYSEVAVNQLDDLEAGSDAALYDAILDAIDLIFDHPSEAQARSAAITTTEGIQVRLPVAGHPPYKVFWSTDVPRVEAVFPYPT